MNNEACQTYIAISPCIPEVQSNRALYEVNSGVRSRFVGILENLLIQTATHYNNNYNQSRFVGIPHYKSRFVGKHTKNRAL